MEIVNVTQTVLKRGRIQARDKLGGRSSSSSPSQSRGRGGGGRGGRGGSITTTTRQGMIDFDDMLYEGLCDPRVQQVGHR